MSILNGLQHIGIPTENFSKTEAFYEALGFDLINTELNQESKVGFFKLQNLILEVWEAKTNPQNGSINHFALDTSDIEKAYAMISKLHVEFVDQKIQHLPFWKNGIAYFNFLGPNHETIEICQILK